MSQSSGDSPKAGTQNANVTPAPLPNQPCSAVMIQNDPNGNSEGELLCVGDVNSQPVRLNAGQAISIACSNADEVYIATGSSTATANFISVF